MRIDEDRVGSMRESTSEKAWEKEGEKEREREKEKETAGEGMREWLGFLGSSS